MKNNYLFQLVLHMQMKGKIRLTSNFLTKLNQTHWLHYKGQNRTNFKFS